MLASFFIHNLRFAFSLLAVRNASNKYNASILKYLKIKGINIQFFFFFKIEMQSVKLQMEVMDSIAPWLLRANIGVVQTGAIGLHVAGFLSASICLPRFWPFHSNLKLCFCVPLVANWCNVP